MMTTTTRNLAPDLALLVQDMKSLAGVGNVPVEVVEQRGEELMNVLNILKF